MAGLKKSAPEMEHPPVYIPQRMPTAKGRPSTDVVRTERTGEVPTPKGWRPVETNVATEERTQASDARAKRMESQHSGFAAAREFMNHLEPHAFTWKEPGVAPNPKAARVPNLGIFAQQVEHSPWGQAIVQEDPQTGLKHIDVRAMTGALAAGLGSTKLVQDDHAQRLEALERVLGVRR